MANTVNDVMNVIASPDYGIKNIAGTNQEILAILQGTHNSKNNIHSIVDDVRSLLQKLVDAPTSKNKPIEIGNKSSKINHKNIRDILDETKGIRKSIDNLAKILSNRQGGKNIPAVAKLSNKASEKVANALIKDIEKQKKGGGISALVDAFTKLKDISLKDIIFGNLKLKKITKLFKNAKENLKIKEKDLNAIIKLINAAPEILKSLSKIGWRINRIIKNDTIKKLSDILIGKKSILVLSKAIDKNKKVFNSANKATKTIKELVISLNKIIRKLAFASLWAKLASIGIKTIEVTLNKLIPLSKKLTKNEKEFKNASKAARKIIALIGNILVTSIFLTTLAVTGIPAILGALVVSVLVNTLVPIAKKLSKSNKHMSKSISSSLMLVAFTGIMTVTSLALSAIAMMGAPALLGALVLAGIVVINIFTFKILNKAKKNILFGALAMAIMSTSLLLFGIALGKITKATENVSFKQIGMIAAITVLLAGCVAIMGIPAVAPFIILGSISMAVMSIGLLAFGVALGKIAKATENLKFKQILIVSGSILTLGITVAGAGLLLGPVILGSIALAALSFALRPFLKTLNKISKMSQSLTPKKIDMIVGSMLTLGLAVAGMAVLTIPIGLGAVALGAMGSTLYTFVKSLKMISDMGGVPENDVNNVINVMKSIGTFFRENALNRKVLRSARIYNRIMRPFSKSIGHLAKLKEIGVIPMKLVYQALDAMKSIGDYFTENPIEKTTIKQARRYKRMLRPFGNTIKYLAKLKELGTLPMKLVYQTLNAMSTIASYYVNNPIERKVIKQARKYKRMLRPFGKTIDFLSKLKEMGTLPMKLVHQALGVMGTIANYYKENPIERKVIKQSRKYKRMMRPFGKTIGFLSKLKEMGTIPMKLVHQALNVMSTIANYYKENPIERKSIRQARRYKRLLRPFGNTIEQLSKLKDLQSIPTNTIKNVLTAMTYINRFYNSIFFIGNIEKKSRLITLSVNEFTKLSNSIRGISELNASNLASVGDALTNTLKGVNSIDMEQVTAVTNMFNAFNGINKSESILNKFSESIKEFTSACKDLMNAMDYNTDAINNIDTLGGNGSNSSIIRENNIFEKGYGDNANQNDGIRISNIDELARTIAEKINGALYVDVPDTQVQLLINGTGGNEWTITRY